jgi:hypothetical protein
VFDVDKLLERVRSYGANIIVDSGGLRLVNKDKLPPQAIPVIAAHSEEIARVLDEDRRVAFEERAAIIEYDGRVPREWAEQFAGLLFTRKPVGVDELDWTWFLSTCGRIIDEAPARSAA